MAQSETGGATTPEPRPWEAAVGRGGDCLKANARRYRVIARNAARAALQTLRRHRIGIAQARKAELHIALYAPDDTSGCPKAVFRIGGSASAPELQLCYARLRDPETPLYNPGGPLDRNAVRAEMPEAARRRAEGQLGIRGLRDVLREEFWQREISLYTGTALFLAALGFPMTPGVFVVGGVLLLIQGAIRLARNEVRIRLLARRISRDETLHPALHVAAVRRLFARDARLEPEDLAARLARTVLRGDVTVPDLTGADSLKMYVDEDARIAAGGLRPRPVAAESDHHAEPPTPDDLYASENVLTVVFRRPKRLRRTDEGTASAAEPAPESGADGKLDIDDIGQESRVPAKVDIDELGKSGGKTKSGKTSAEDEDVEVVEAEVIPPEEFFKPGGGRSA